MARINPEKVNSLSLRQQSIDQGGNGMYANYDRDITSNARDNVSMREVIPRREEGMFYKLRKLMYGPDIIPDIDKMVNSRLTQSQIKKLQRYEEYYRRIQSTIN